MDESGSPSRALGPSITPGLGMSAARYPSAASGICSFSKTSGRWENTLISYVKVIGGKCLEPQCSSIVLQLHIACRNNKASSVNTGHALLFTTGAVSM